MTSLKKGFTLAEILISMTIVGIIASLVLPQIMLKSRNVQAGAVLGKAVQQIELGAKNYIAEYNEKHSDYGYTDTLSQANPTITSLAPYFGSTFVESVTKYEYKEYNDSEITTIDTPAYHFKFDKLKADYYIRPASNIDAKYVCIIDINGFDTKPNMLGKDMFYFGLHDDGKMKPYGLDSTDHYKVNCTDTNITDGKACAARVVADGFRINY